MNAAVSAVPPPVGKAAGANTMLRELGGVFGIAVTVAVFAGAGGYASPQGSPTGSRRRCVSPPGSRSPARGGFVLLAAARARRRRRSSHRDGVPAPRVPRRSPRGLDRDGQRGIRPASVARAPERLRRGRHAAADVAGEARIVGERARPASGPSTKPIATARLAATTGEGSGRASSA